MFDNKTSIDNNYIANGICPSPTGEARWGLMCLNFCPSPQVDGRIILTDIFILHFHLKKAWVLSIYSIIFNKFRHLCCDI